MFIVKIVLRILINFISLLVADYFIRDILIDNHYSVFLAAIALGIVHAVIRPIIKLVALPVTILTLGLFLFVINGFMLLLVAWIVPGFEVHGLWAAIKGALVVSVLSWVLEVVFMPKKAD